MTQKTILLVEGNDSVRKAVTLRLEDEGFKVLSAADHSKALHLFLSHQNAISNIVVELESGADAGRADIEAGLKFISSIRILDPKIPIAALTRTFEAPEIVKRKLKDAGGADFVQKVEPRKSAMDQVVDLIKHPPVRARA